MGKTFFQWVIPGKLAQSPMPRLSDIPALTRYFTGVVALMDQYEAPLNYVESLASHGLEVLYMPTRDQHPVELLDLLRASFFIEHHVKSGGAVLVHCVGGLGRSGVVTASFLVFNGLTAYDAVMELRSIIPGALENPWQVKMVRTYEVFLNSLSELGQLLRSVANWIKAVDFRIARHLSRVIQFHIELHDPLHVNTPCMRQGLMRLITTYLSGKSILSHIDEELCLPEALDYDYSGRVVTLYIDTVDKPVVTLLCDDDCSVITNKAMECRKHALELLGGDTVFKWDYYSNYV
ncbi:MAG: dual specificity protein phosphatase family protein [Desulfurococcus sp.]